MLAKRILLLLAEKLFSLDVGSGNAEGKSGVPAFAQRLAQTLRQPGGDHRSCGDPD